MLTVGVNSWVSTLDALRLSEERVDLAGLIAYINQEFNATSDYSLAEAALIQAYHSIKKFRFLVPSFSSIKPEPFFLSDLTADEFAQLPSDFLYALKMAQLLEASNLLGLGDPTEAYARNRRQAGIIEEQVGESRTVFAALHQAPGADSTVSPKALSVLSGFLYRTVKLARA